jgi:hypothetical protein
MAHPALVGHPRSAIALLRNSSCATWQILDVLASAWDIPTSRREVPLGQLLGELGRGQGADALFSPHPPCPAVDEKTASESAQRRNGPQPTGILQSESRAGLHFGRYHSPAARSRKSTLVRRALPGTQVQSFLEEPAVVATGPQVLGHPPLQQRRPFLRGRPRASQAPPVRPWTGPSCEAAPPSNSLGQTGAPGLPWAGRKPAPMVRGSLRLQDLVTCPGSVETPVGRASGPRPSKPVEDRCQGPSTRPRASPPTSRSGA